MRYPHARFAAALLLGALSSLGLTRTVPASAHRPDAGAPIPEVRRWQFTSSNTGEVYAIQMYTPTVAPPSRGFPVIYVLDGGALFGTFMEAVRTRANAGELDRAVVVGIDGVRGPKGADRFYDYSSSDFSAEEKTFVVDADVNARHGGSELFFRTLEQEIKPRVVALARIDRAHTTLFGWSLGGQFVLHALFRHPDSFQTFEALSPSIWWNNNGILNDVPVLFETLSHDRLTPRVFIGAGSREQDMPNGNEGRDLELLKREMQHARMVDNARDLASDLQVRDVDHRLILASRIFDGQTHNSVPWAAVNTVLDFAIGRQPSAAR